MLFSFFSYFHGLPSFEVVVLVLISLGERLEGYFLDDFLGFFFGWFGGFTVLFFLLAHKCL
jgi:hypothetical protein